MASRSLTGTWITWILARFRWYRKAAMPTTRKSTLPNEAQTITVVLVELLEPKVCAFDDEEVDEPEDVGTADTEDATTVNVTPGTPDDTAL